MGHLFCNSYTLLFGFFASFFCIFCFAVFFIVTCCFCFSVLQAIAFAGDVYYLSMMQESVKDCCGGGDVTDQFAPLFQRTIRCHHRSLQLVPSHYHFKKVFAGTFRQRLDAHVVDYQQVRFEIFIHDFILPGEGFITHEVANHIEDRPVFYRVPSLDRLVTDGLCDVTFTHAGRADQQNISALTNELTGREIIHRFPRH